MKKKAILILIIALVFGSGAKIIKNFDYDYCNKGVYLSLHLNDISMGQTILIYGRENNINVLLNEIPVERDMNLIEIGFYSKKIYKEYIIRILYNEYKKLKYEEKFIINKPKAIRFSKK